MNSSAPACLSSRQFFLDDQLAFARLSGDHNPIHIDPVAARRLISGEVVVHGVHTLLWALNAYLAHTSSTVSGIAALSVRFVKPVVLNQTVALYVDIEASGTTWLRVKNEAGQDLTVVRLTPGDEVNPASPEENNGTETVPDTPAFEDLKGRRGNLAVGVDSTACRRLFPALTDRIGMVPVAGLMALSRLVGMQIPGLHSLFAGLTVTLDSSCSRSSIDFHVKRAINSKAPIDITIDGAGLKGNVTAFFRPAPVAQTDFSAIAKQVSKDEFADQNALIVGGSRGLGELTAKIVAAGGGKVTLTYFRGAEDAERLAATLRDQGRVVDVLPLDVLDPASVCGLSETGRDPFSAVYYFATPHIGQTPVPGRYTTDKGHTFFRYFVDGFASVCQTVAAKGPVTAFYPSTVFVDQMPAEQTEYVVAKTAGEMLCRYLDRDNPSLTVIVERLPRMATDQTSGFVGPAGEAPFDVLLDVVRAVSRSLEKGQLQ